MEIIHPERISVLKKKAINKNGKYILYWVQDCLRIDYNQSLSYSIYVANKFKKPLLIFFGLKKFSFSNWRQYNFLKVGLIEFKKKIESLGGNFLVEFINSFDRIIELGKDAVIVVADFGYLAGQRRWRLRLSERLSVPLILIESNILLPIKIASQKRLNFAFQLRKKIFQSLPYFSSPVVLPELKIKKKLCEQKNEDIEKIFQGLDIENFPASSIFKGGEAQADNLLRFFLEKKLPYYQKKRSDPGYDYQSNLSPYLHFGFLSPIKVINEIKKRYSFNDPNVKSFLNELLVWRELARNFVYYEPNYFSWKNLPKWATSTLDIHKNDKRDYLYNLNQLEKGETHDIYWNTAQKEMVFTGKMHNYMRMYWAKKVIEWTQDWRLAYKWLVYLNDKYELDGRDPNGYAGIAWSFGQFDHPWIERKIFGKVRYMSEDGLCRKFDMDKYLKRVDYLVKNSNNIVIK